MRVVRVREGLWLRRAPSGIKLGEPGDLEAKDEVSLLRLSIVDEVGVVAFGSASLLEVVVKRRFWGFGNG